MFLEVPQFGCILLEIEALYPYQTHVCCDRHVIMRILGVAGDLEVPSSDV